MYKSSYIEGKKKPVLLYIDSDPVYLEKIYSILRKEFEKDYEIQTAGSHLIALEIVQTCNRNLIELPIVLCSQQIPVIRASEIIAIIHETNPSTRKIIFTESISSEDLLTAINKANIFKALPKDIEEKDLVSIIQEGIKSFYSEKDLREKNVKLEKLLFFNNDTNLANWERFQQRLLEYSRKNLSLTVAIIKIENYTYFLEYFGAKIYKKILLELIEIISSTALSGEEMFHTQQDEFLVLSKKPVTEDFIYKFSVLRLLLKSQYIVVENLSFQISLFISITSGNKNLYSTAKSGLIHRFNGSGPTNASIHINEIEFHKENILWGQKLNTAIQNKLITPFYQGIQDNKTGEIVKYECLVRMHDNGEIIYPDKFLNLASAMGLMKLITIIVMDKAFSHFQNSNKSISINITQFDLEYKDFAQLVQAKLALYKINPSRITFEILENVSFGLESQTLKTLHELKEIGCKIAIDDFGVHYSNLARLLEIQPDYLKIDGWFIKNIIQNRNAYLVTKAIIELSHSLNAEVVAEFVTNEEIQNKLVEMGVEFSQGYFIGKPEEKIF
ncbi:MAG TPA: EAL domain-containing protein [Leptospiraceae bacterium]|nr:EAL domain-containing protein [Leptospiraceae bacterium]HMW06892.1 EAL domain-containing protein [Leptospiraceae bacterium]HMX34066.1 EAL domain-containing protein [Leptospiraceae bacterium]HMY32411.1 EAL domain-containing protein [Leptospiraceae bacterium]HMZ65293.1 EAL domain-containing protein [Leptospiraceae bacterium]